MSARARHATLIGLLGAAAFAALALGVGCGGEGVQPAADAGDGDAGHPDSGPPDSGPPDSGPPDSGPSDAGPLEDAGPWRRNVAIRSPWGRRADNLFVDGDFEMSASPYTGNQFGNRLFDSAGSTELPITMETGGLCHSGLRCAVFSSSTVMFMRGAAAPDNQPMKASMAVKPSTPMCTGISAYPINCDSGIIFGIAAMAPVSPTPGDDGWCSYTAPLPGRNTAVCLYVENTLVAGDSALIDDAVLEVDASGAQTDSSFHPSLELQQRAARVAAYVRGKMPLGRPARPTRSPAR